MKVILVAGGSGGHIYPCLELAKFLLNKGEKVLLCGCNDSMEEKIYRSNNLDFKGLNIDKNKIKSFFKSKKDIIKIYDDFQPDAIILFGNYISISFAIIAIFKKIPIYLHEQNVIYGDANKLIGLKAKRIYLSLPIAKDIYKSKSVVVGNPKSDMEIQAYKYKRKNNIVIAMGSLGSSSINKILKEFINIASNENEYHIVIGNKYYDKFIKEVNLKDNIHLYPYLENLSSYIKGCDIFVSRAGATTISEILVNGVASILIPSPYVKHDHQYKNAKYLKDNNACILLEEKDLTALKMERQINDLLKDYKKRLLIKENAKKLASYNTKNKIYKDMISKYE